MQNKIDTTPENTGRIQGKFQKGHTGNPHGKPKGARHRSSLLAERLFSNEIEDICSMVLAEAKAGNMQAAKIILDRILPPRKDRPIEIDLSPMKNSGDLVQAMASIVSAVSLGQISPSEGEAVARILDVDAKILELKDVEQRLSALERKTT